MGNVEATGLEMGDGFIDDGLVFDPIMERAVGRIGGGGEAENAVDDVGFLVPKGHVRGEEIKPGHGDGAGQGEPLSVS